MCLYFSGMYKNVLQVKTNGFYKKPRDRLKQQSVYFSARYREREREVDKN